MREWLHIAALSLMVGCVAAGFVWFGTGILENLRARRRQREESRQMKTETKGGSGAERPSADQATAPSSATGPVSTGRK